MLVSIEWHLLHFNFKIIYRFKKDARKDNKAIVSDCAKYISRPIHGIFMLNVTSYICIVNTFFVLYCQYSLHSLLPNCHDL